MTFYEGLTYYDILDITPDATPQEIREAYLRTKATYSRDSVALYTLISTEEREDALKVLEEAYYVLSNSEKRKDYDRDHGFLNSGENPFVSGEPSATVIPIDRSVPSDDFESDDSLLIPPKTDFTPTSPARMPKAPDSSSLKHQTRKNPLNSTMRATLPELSPDLTQAIELETEWRGAFLKTIREAYQISIEEMSGITRVTKNYLIAIEEDNYSKLPAPVFIRGFVGQIAKVLKLPHEKVATAYLSRYYASKTQLSP